MSTSERTSLIQTVTVTSPRPRYKHSTLRRFCTIALSSTSIVILIAFLSPIGWLSNNESTDEGYSDFLPWPSKLPHKEWPRSEGLPYKDLQEILLTTPSPDKAREWSQYYTSGPHLAGKNLSQAIRTKELWEEFGIPQSTIASYDVYLNYPIGHRLALLEKSRDIAEGPAQERKAEKLGGKVEVRFECGLEEDILDEDPTSGLESRIPTFHGYSASGNVTARYVYANFGTWWDFQDLVKANISLEGKIALVKYGRNFRGLKVKRAQELGMIGVVMYSDPQQDGNVTELNGYKAYPQGPARNPSSVERGSTSYMSILPGDPTTPGYPSKPGVPRQDPSQFMPSIPSIPISYQDALPLLKALNGHGANVSSFNKWWQGGGLGYKGVDYNIGPSPAHIMLNLVNEQEYVTTPIWNVIGIVNGTLSDEVIILGNHRDAWIAGGAGDPNSGSAALNEVVRSFGAALAQGWKPLRTVVFASWDGEEYGLVGSTEWVEEYLPWLSNAAIAYLNVDIGVRSQIFHVNAAPLLNQALYNATSLVLSPNQTIPGQTVRDVWNGHIGTLGSGSDFTAFQDFAGIPSVDMSFSGYSNTTVYHYHSNYDSLAWMDAFGDPGFLYHTAMSKVWALLAIHLIENPIIAFNVTDYALSLSSYLNAVNRTASTSPNQAIRALPSFTHLNQSITTLLNATSAFETHAAILAAAISEDIPWWKWWQKIKLYHDVRQVNSRYKLFERKFLHEDGLDDRPWFKHTVFAPGIWTGYAGARFPGLAEGLDKEDVEGVERWAKILGRKIDDAAASLRI